MVLFSISIDAFSQNDSIDTYIPDMKISKDNLNTWGYTLIQKGKIEKLRHE